MTESGGDPDRCQEIGHSSEQQKQKELLAWNSSRTVIYRNRLFCCCETSVSYLILKITKIPPRASVS